jgi:hypothetical protein
MSDQELTTLLTDIRDLQRRQAELTEQQLKNQAQALANQEQSLSRQLSNQQILIKGRQWTRILLGLLAAGVFLHLLQPLLFFWLAWPRGK